MDKQVVETIVKRIRKLECKDPSPSFYFGGDDPGAVGADSFWLNTATNVLSYRNSTDTAWIGVAGGAGSMTNPMTVLGDIIVALAGGTPDRLGIGGAGRVLTVSGGVPSWQPLPVDPLLDHSHTAPGDGGNFDADILNSGAATDGQVLTADGATGAAWEDLPASGPHDILSATHDDTTVSVPSDQDVLTWDNVTGKWIAQAPPASTTMATDPLWDAAGDLAVGTGANTGGRLAIGSAGEVLTVVAGTPSWEPAASGSVDAELAIMNLLGWA